MEWPKLLEDYRRYLTFERNLSINSVHAYSNDAQKLQAFCELNKLEIEVLNTQDIQSFLIWINEFAISANSQARIISGIKSLFNFLQLEYDLQHNPTELIEAPRLTRAIPETLSIIEIDSLIQAIDLSSDEGMRNKTMLEVLYGCGLRVSELINLKISDLYLEIEFIKVSGKGNKERIIPIGKQAIKFLNIYLNEVRNSRVIKPGFEDYVFLNRRGAPLSRVMVFIIIKDLAEKIELKKNISPHTFRHSFASHLVEGGADLRAVQDMLGHESITTTEIYTHVDKEYLQTVITQYHPRS